MIENLLTYIWLERVHPGLPKLVQLRFSTELRSRTLASLKDEISQGLSSMLEELRTAQTQQVTVNAVRPPPRSRDYNSRNRQPRRAHCELCAAIKQESDHFLSRCPRVSEENKKLLKAGLKVKLTDVEQQEGESEGEEDSGDEMYCSTIRPVTPKQPSPRAIIVGRVATTEASPYLDVFCGSRAAKITLDTGCVGGNCIKAETAHRLNLPISKTKRKAFQADGATPLNVVGEVKTVFTRDDHRLPFQGLVVKDLEVDILGGTPFLRENDVYSRVAQNTVYVGNSQYPYKPGGKSSQSVTARVTSITPVHVTLQSKRARYILPGEEAEFEVPDQFEDADVLAVESRSQREWPSPQLVDCVGGKFRIQNTSENTQVLNRHEHFATVRATQAVNDIPQLSMVNVLSHRKRVRPLFQNLMLNHIRRYQLTLTTSCPQLILMSLSELTRNTRLCSNKLQPDIMGILESLRLK